MNEQQTPHPDGTITEVRGTTYMVRLDDGRTSRARTNSATRSSDPDSSLVAVGDRVTLRLHTGGDIRYQVTADTTPESTITHVHPRHSALTRQRDPRRNRSRESTQIIAANIDQLVIVTSPREPALNTRLIDRYLVFAESETLTPLIVVNKNDLDPDHHAARQLQPYRHLGYNICFVSALTTHGLDELGNALAGRCSAFSGHSGVGKSSLINLLAGQTLRTSGTNCKTGKGLHTTTSTIMFPIAGGGHIIDTPGIREFSLTGITRDNLRFWFPEFRPLMTSCSYTSCTHTVEPGCAIREAATQHHIVPERYESYLAIFDTIEA